MQHIFVQCLYDSETQKLRWVENTKETIPPLAETNSDDRLRKGVRQLIRKENHTDKEVIEYIKVSSAVSYNFHSNSPAMDRQTTNKFQLLHSDLYKQMYLPNMQDKQNIRAITKILIEAALNKTKGEFLLNAKFLDRSIDILEVFIGSEDNEDLQLESIIAIQLLSNKLEHPSGEHSAVWPNY